MSIKCLSLFTSEPNIGTVVLATVLAVLFTTPLAWLSWRAIEVPSKNWGRAERGLATAAPVAAD